MHLKIGGVTDRSDLVSSIQLLLCCHCSAAFPTRSCEDVICWNTMVWENFRSYFFRLTGDDLIYRSSCNTIATSYVFFFGNQYGNIFCPATEFWSSPERRKFRVNLDALCNCTCFINYSFMLELLQICTEDCRWNNEKKNNIDRSRIQMAKHLGKKFDVCGFVFVLCFFFSSCQWTVWWWHFSGAMLGQLLKRWDEFFLWTRIYKIC